MARLTALRKTDGKAIATSDVSRRFVTRALVQEWAQVFDSAIRLCAYSPRSRPARGTDAVAASVRAALSLCPGTVTVLMSLDGRSAYDSMSRVAFLSTLRARATGSPFRAVFVYGRPSSYCWWDATGA
eukprot:s552_g12.t1